MMCDLTQVQLLPAESGTARRGEPDLTQQEIALIVTAGGGRYVGLLQNTPGRMETVILFASPQTETTLGLCMSRFNVEAVRERIAKSDELFAKAVANVCGAGVLLRYTFDDSSVSRAVVGVIQRRNAAAPGTPARPPRPDRQHSASHDAVAT
jgi:hypothetical protein